MFDKTFDKTTRKHKGIHYTPDVLVEKILTDTFGSYLSRLEFVSTVAELDSLYDDFKKIKLFDPACGSGNFLVGGYKFLVRLELAIWKKYRSFGITPPSKLSFNPSRLYGIDVEQSALDECSRRIEQLYQQIKSRGFY